MITGGEEPVLRHRESCKHLLGRRGYANGAGFCIHCNAFFSGAFPAIVTLGTWRKPLCILEIENIKDGYLLPFTTAPQFRMHVRQVYLKARVAGIELPPMPQIKGLDPEQYQKVAMDFREASHAAVTDYLVRNIDRLEEVLVTDEPSSLAPEAASIERRRLLEGLLEDTDLDNDQKTKVEALLASDRAILKMTLGE